MNIILIILILFPDTKGNYFSFFIENFHDIMSIFIPKILFYTPISIIFYFLLLDVGYSRKNNITVSKFINSLYMGFKGMIRVSIKENEIEIERAFSNSIIESKIIENIINYENVLYFLDKNNYVLLFIPFDELIINNNEIILNIEKHLNKKVREV